VKEAKDWVPAMSAACLPLYLWAAESGGIPLHAALLGRAGEAVALAAAGGTGKSTAAARIPGPWRALGDDLALIVPGEAGEEPFMIHPLPTWSDYAFERSEGVWKVEERLPLRAVFFLSRAERDAVLDMGRAEAAIRISQSAYQILISLMTGFAPAERRGLLTALFDNAGRMTRSVPMFTLEASLTGCFWSEIERVL
jgi:SynChlorMet cassette protein ScmC